MRRFFASVAGIFALAVLISAAPALGDSAYTNKILKKEPGAGKLPNGASVLVDDGTCPKGQIKKIVGGSFAKGQRRMRSCVPRP